MIAVIIVYTDLRTESLSFSVLELLSQVSILMMLLFCEGILVFS